MAVRATRARPRAIPRGFASRDERTLSGALEPIVGNEGIPRRCASRDDAGRLPFARHFGFGAGWAGALTTPTPSGMLTTDGPWFTAAGFVVIAMPSRDGTSAAPCGPCITDPGEPVAGRPPPPPDAGALPPCIARLPIETRSLFAGPAACCAVIDTTLRTSDLRRLISFPSGYAL